MSDIYLIIDRLERLLHDSWQVPLSQYVVLNEAECLDVIDQMRTAIPRQIRDAERIQQERERIVAQAGEEAQRIVQQAREQAAALTEQHEVLKAAQVREVTIIERAQQEAAAHKRAADEYAREVLGSLDDQLAGLTDQVARLLTTVRNGIQELHRTDGAEADGETEDPTISKQLTPDD